MGEEILAESRVKSDFKTQMVNLLGTVKLAKKLSSKPLNHKMQRATYPTSSEGTEQ